MLVIICILAFNIFFLKGGKNEVKYNNEQNYQEKITYLCTSEEFSDIQEELKNGRNMHLQDIIDQRKIECVRMTGDIGYVVLLSEHDEKLFLFFNSDSIVVDAYYIEDDFLDQKDFSDIQIGITKESDIEMIDKSPIYYAISAESITGHIVKEGIIIIKYNRFLDGNILADPIVKSVDFYDNDKLLISRESDFAILSTPYILPIDRQ